MEIKDLAGLSEPLKKLIEVVSQGIGILYEPVHIKKMAKAKALEIEMISSAVQKTHLPIQYKNGEVSMNAPAQNLVKRTETRLLFTEAKKQKNIEDIVSETYNYLENEQEVSSEPLQEEWISRFFNIAGEISSDDLKTIWSKILSEEIKNPGVCSIRTLETLKNISRSEAEIFKKISNYIVEYRGICYLPNEDVLLQEANINYGEILKLDEALLINSSIGVNAHLEFNENNNKNYLIYNNKVIICEKKEKNNINLPIYTLTEVGKNIFEILSPMYDECFFEKYIGIIKNEMNISHSTIIKKLPNGQIKYEIPVTNV